MKKQDILNALQTKFACVLGTRRVELIGAVGWYVANVLDLAGTCGTKGNVGFYVVCEGQETEAAYWHGTEPKPAAPEPTMQAHLQEYLTALIVADTVEGASITSIDVTNQTATVTVWIVSGSNVATRSFFVDKDVQGNWRRREIVVV